MKGHYRSPINYSVEQIKNAKNSLKSLYHILNLGEESNELSEYEQKQYVKKAMKSNNPYALDFRNAIEDDFNTPKALATLFSFASAIKNQRKSVKKSQVAIFRGLGLILGLFVRLTSECKNFSNEISTKTFDNEINNLILQRSVAKNSKDFKKADEIRDYLNAQGIILEDGLSGTKWRRS